VRWRTGERQAAEGDGLRRGALRTDQLAPKTLLSERLPPAVGCAPPLRVDLSLRRRRFDEWRELLLVSAGHGWSLLRDFPRTPRRSVPGSSPRARTRQRSQPPLQRDHPSRERESPEAAGLLSRTQPHGERWFLEFRRAFSNKTFESVELLQEALTEALAPYWREPTLLQRLTGYSWWVEAVGALGHQ